MAPRQRLNSSTATQQQQDDVDSTGSESTAGLLPEDSNRDSKLSSSVSASKNLPTEADIARDQHDYFNLVALVRLFHHPFLPPPLVGFCCAWAKVFFCLRVHIQSVEGSGSL